ncbi:MAG: MetQ/NlpA family ABC transporter substrate-binding protein [Bifidobacteriaceae bacterium]|jgi:D-methionine transport system substrate-binding protein|nr:MetQ/NlpA family ABC transporter substrate-binding protein [Bifidobacteriaceae bacterium]MCI1979638.1 MetQ/NlpA family ABC transporter substrate-binding protein [Bifidobacteriaceae bacterium]
MKLKSLLATVVIAATALGLGACGTSNSSAKLANAANGSTTKITVGVAAGPYGDMVTDIIAPLLKDDGYELTTKVFNDYVQPNKALAGGQIDANLFQHTNYLTQFTKDNKLDLTSLGPVPTLGLGIYSKKYTSLKDIPDGATVSIAADASNLARSLGVLEQNNLITVKKGVSATQATVNDIATNPKNLKFKTLDAAQLSRSLDNVDVSLVPGNYAWAANLKITDALATEKQSKGVFNVFVINSKDKNSDFAKKVKALLTSQEFKDAIAKSDFKDFGKPWTWDEK